MLSPKFTKTSPLRGVEVGEIPPLEVRELVMYTIMEHIYALVKFINQAVCTSQN